MGLFSSLKEEDGKEIPSIILCYPESVLQEFL